MTQHESPLAIVILAAGKGKRMNNPDLPKVMAPLAGTPLIGHVLGQVDKLAPRHVVSVVGHHRELVIDYVRQAFPHLAEFAVQAEQLGTGHAVAQAETFLNDFAGNVLILSGDVPLLRAETLDSFVRAHETSGAAVTVLSVHAPEPKGYGRIIRDEQNAFLRIVEEKDASDAERGVKEINSGIYAVRKDLLFEALRAVRNENAQGEYYLTDIIGILRSQGHPVQAFAAGDFNEFQGINTVDELARAEEAFLATRSA